MSLRPETITRQSNPLQGWASSGVEAQDSIRYSLRDDFAANLISTTDSRRAAGMLRVGVRVLRFDLLKPLHGSAGTGYGHRGARVRLLPGNGELYKCLA